MRHSHNLGHTQVLLASLFIWIVVCTEQVSTSPGSQCPDCETKDSSYFFYQQPVYPRDCQEVLNQCFRNISSGVYFIKPDGYANSFEVYCDNEIDGGGWTVFYRRTGGFVNFHRTWLEYEHGFGFILNEFWLGNEMLSFLTNQKDYEIRIDMENAAGSIFYITYNLFRVTDEHSNFTLDKLGTYSGTADGSIVSCPLNMKYGNCTCQATCEDPNGRRCQLTCDEEEICICQEGFLRKGDECILPTECGCFIEGKGVILDGQSYVNDNCTSRCECHSNILTCDNDYSCDDGATCREMNGVRQCYCNDGFTGDGTSCEIIGTDCNDIFSAGFNESGVYTVKPANWPGPPFEVYCNMTDGGGWTVIQRRKNGSEDFYLGWNSYKEGFGSPDHELWLGNEKIYYMTNQKNYQLGIYLVEVAGTPYYAKYDLFRINDENDNYRLIGLGSYTGNTRYDAMSFHRNRSFSTHDGDNDDWTEYNCAARTHSGWWHGKKYVRETPNCRFDANWCHHFPIDNATCGWCSVANLNGDYDSSTRGTSIYWAGDGLSGYECNIRFSEMKIKPV